MTTLQKIKDVFGDEIVKSTEIFGETTCQVEKGSLIKVLSYLKQDLLFEMLMDMTGVDYLQPTPRTKVVYWLHNLSTLERIRIAIFVARDAALPTVTVLWEGADWYERELYDLFGVHFEEHPNLTRILMPDDWVGHPLRKDYPLTEEPVQFKHGIKPKVPSEIIPYVKDRRESN